MTTSQQRQSAAAGWTPERVERLKALWLADGMSCSQIASQLGGVTRNAVIGKIHRLGLAGHAKASPPSKAPKSRGNGIKARKAREGALKPALGIAGGGQVFEKRDAPPSPLPPTRADAWKPLPGSKPRHLMDRPGNGCRWPIDMPGDALGFVCCVKTDKGPYCREHEGMAVGKVPRAWTESEFVRFARRAA